MTPAGMCPTRSARQVAAARTASGYDSSEPEPVVCGWCGPTPVPGVRAGGNTVCATHRMYARKI